MNAPYLHVPKNIDENIIPASNNQRHPPRQQETSRTAQSPSLQALTTLAFKSLTRQDPEPVSSGPTKRTPVIDQITEPSSQEDKTTAKPPTKDIVHDKIPGFGSVSDVESLLSLGGVSDSDLGTGLGGGGLAHRIIAVALQRALTSTTSTSTTTTTTTTTTTPRPTTTTTKAPKPKRLPSNQEGSGLNTQEGSVLWALTNGARRTTTKPPAQSLDDLQKQLLLLQLLREQAGGIASTTHKPNANRGFAGLSLQDDLLTTSRPTRRPRQRTTKRPAPASTRPTRPPRIQTEAPAQPSDFSLGSWITSIAGASRPQQIESGARKRRPSGGSPQDDDGIDTVAEDEEEDGGEKKQDTSLVTIAIGVTKAVSNFMGRVFTGAARTLAVVLQEKTRLLNNYFGWR